MRTDPRLLAALLPLLASAQAAFPFTFDPISRDFAPSGRDSIQSFRLANDGSEAIAVRIQMLTRDMDPDGKETNAPADPLFLVYPSRVVLEARSVQAVKVQWKGPSDLPVERCFRILVEQVPVEFGGEKKPGGSIRVLFRYLGTVYVVPSGARPEVVLDSSRPALGEGGRPGLELRFSNKGNAHAILADLQLTLSPRGPQASAPRRLAPADLPGINGENLLPGTSRRFFLPLPADLASGDFDVAFHFEAVR